MLQVLGRGMYFEDFPVGMEYRTQGRTIFEADVATFIGCTGLNESLFTDTEYLRDHTGFSRRIAPAGLSYMICEGLQIPLIQQTAIAFLGMELTVNAPVFIGDTIHAEVRVTEARPSTSKPDRGLLRTEVRIVNQEGRCVIVYTPLRMIKRRPA